MSAQSQRVLEQLILERDEAVKKSALLRHMIINLVNSVAEMEKERTAVMTGLSGLERHIREGTPLRFKDEVALEMIEQIRTGESKEWGTE